MSCYIASSIIRADLSMRYPNVPVSERDDGSPLFNSVRYLKKGFGKCLLAIPNTELQVNLPWFWGFWRGCDTSCPHITSSNFLPSCAVTNRSLR